MESKIPKYDGLNLADIQAYMVKEAVIPAVSQIHSSTLPAEKKKETVDEFSDPKTQELAQEVCKRNLEIRGNSDGFKMDIFNYQSDSPEDVGALRNNDTVYELAQDQAIDRGLNSIGKRRPPAPLA